MTTKEKIIEAIGEVPEAKLPELLGVVEDFKKKTAAPQKGKWSRYAGILSDKEADAMLAAIERECEVIEDDV